MPNCFRSICFRVSAMGLTMVAAANLVEVAALVDDTARATMGNGEPVVPIFIGRGRNVPRERPQTRRVDDSDPRETVMPRQLIEPHGDKRYVRRGKKGQFTSRQVDVGRSLSADRRSKAKRIAKKGEGDRGDRRSG